MHQGKSLELFLKAKKQNLSDLAAQLEISRTQLYKYFSTQTLEENTIKNLEKALGVRFAEIQKSHPVNGLHKGELYITKRSKIKQDDTIVLVPLVPHKARAGYATSYEHADYVNKLERYQLPPGINPRGSEWRWFEVGGDSMEPVLRNGDIVLCSLVPINDWREIKDFLIYVLVTKTEVCIKRVAKKGRNSFVLISEDDDNYDQKLMPIEEVREMWRLRRQLNAHLPPTRRFKIRV